MVIEKKYYKVDSKELVDLLIQHINEKEIIAYDTETNSLWAIAPTRLAVSSLAISPMFRITLAKDANSLRS